MNDARTFRTEFPEMPVEWVPAFLTAPDSGWRDASWANDGMPFFIHEASGVGLWINPGAMFLPHEFQFTAVKLAHDAEHGWQHGDDITLIMTDDAEVAERSLPNFTIPNAIANAFADTLREWASDDEWEAMRRANVENAGTPICASHDFCDANMAMHGAFVDILGRNPLPDDGPMADADVALWNLAWEFAKADRLTGQAA